GLEKWVWEQGRGVWEENSAVEALEGFITDITQDRRNQDRILQSQKELRSLYHRLES
ncbi:MAG: hypothetical protein GWM98_26380, partial [Nitrospinaceae bacterium]|nr:hypothetical protein [Nitrospinaceae bacterium]NIR57353.1 hypothetical protein [Nitrospinaceae bacterium]NIS87805.1 hypothetical protein [Nitrospinaceae bacterium]NIT84675.1 hypothetical protein [Nitrospinaceae bacterium]NIU46854.1 hypothetical protein [Nitrospinaceae bacterium]